MLNVIRPFLQFFPPHPVLAGRTAYECAALARNSY
jgi:hypothetical protein